jgi:single-strand DNA-binding protein
MNSITIAGVVGKDAEHKILQDGTHIASFSVADSQGKDKTIWWNINLWGRKAESLHSHIVKGTKVTVSGVVSEETWNDRTSGEARKSLRVRVNDILLQSNRQESRPQQSVASIDEDAPF